MMGRGMVKVYLVAGHRAFKRGFVERQGNRG